MLQLGESGRFEFKQNLNPVKPRVLAALANWVALEEDRTEAHLLIGVEEVEDESSGLVLGRPCGLPVGLDRTVAALQDIASKTRPIPVDAFIIEEGVETAMPFVRVEIRPTMAPHFDDEGRRQTRQGRSTRALTDDELLQIYLQRESSNFAARYRQISSELRAALGSVATQVDSISAAIETRIADPLDEVADAAASASMAAQAAESAAEDVALNVRRVRSLLEDVDEAVGEVHDTSPGALAAKLSEKRLEVWLLFAVDTYTRSSARALGLEKRLLAQLGRDLAIDADTNEWEVRTWSVLLEERRGQRASRGTLAWWTTQVERVEQYREAPGYEPPTFPDLRAELQNDSRAAMTDTTSSTHRLATHLGYRFE